MTPLAFAKLHGAGNDYLFVDGIRDATLEAELLAPHVAALCDRHRGVGSDGVILLVRGAGDAVRMVMWNADGSRGAFCGNGVRCLAYLARVRGHVSDDTVEIDTDVGRVRVELRRDPRGAVVGGRSTLPPLTLAPRSESDTLAGRALRWRRAATGNPHAVVLLPAGIDLEMLPVARLGAAFQADARFDGGVNVEFVTVLADDRIRCRTFERGSGETLACGSGATAAAAVARAEGRVRGDRIAVELRGGELQVEFDADGPRLAGPCALVCEGTADLDALGTAPQRGS
ncbi:MAG: diaminopimelate epimerase [Planctomycetes bacterium]|nr:diaminopimelate epimerase [Planctomycetota bacterium]